MRERVNRDRDGEQLFRRKSAKGSDRDSDRERERERGRQRREETASDSQRKARFGVFIYPGLLFTPFRWFMHFSIAAKTLKNNIT